MLLKQLKRSGNDTLVLTWDDGHSGPVSLKTLRDACPCAGCKGESVLFREVPPAPSDISAPGRDTLLRAEPVGSYALKFSWADGHDQGIYTWELLRSLCECESCLRMKNVGEATGGDHG
jgi:DUF971 family protein